jgi:hypothetical protein
MAAACEFVVPIVIIKTLRADGRRGSVPGYHAARLQKCSCHASPAALLSDPIIAQAMLWTPIKGPGGSRATSGPMHQLSKTFRFRRRTTDRLPDVVLSHLFHRVGKLLQ